MLHVHICRGGARNHGNAAEESVWQGKVSLICLNPACIFRKIARRARSVILTSGTLSPMDSFASELGADFRHQMEGNHVVPREQVRRPALAGAAAMLDMPLAWQSYRVCDKHAPLQRQMACEFESHMC